MTPELFIKQFKSMNKQHVLENTFTKGYCYYFAIIMQTRFPGGKIMYDSDYAHFVYQYKNKLYDITGNVTNQYTNISDKWNDTIRNDCMK